MRGRSMLQWCVVVACLRCARLYLQGCTCRDEVLYFSIIAVTPRFATLPPTQHACDVASPCRHTMSPLWLHPTTFTMLDSSSFLVQADEAYRIGPSSSSESYLCADKILDVAVRSGARAVHPGYGFLSENESFSRACKAAGIEFVGPPESAMRDMGSKAASKSIMTAAGVPVTPGYWGEDQSVAALSSAARSFGFPIMVKAVMGGGGKGMRVVNSAAELEGAVEACRREAGAAFGDTRVLLERYLPTPRHVELQVRGAV